MSGPSLIELKREWIGKPSEWRMTGTDCYHFNHSIVPGTVGDVWENGICVNAGTEGFRWDATFGVRRGNTEVILHSDDFDPQLRRYVKKLKRLRYGIEEHINAMKYRIRKQDNTTPVRLKRVWLNQLVEQTPFTAHYLSEVHWDGRGKFMFGDCQRSIVMWIDTYALEEKMKFLRGVVDGIAECIESVKELRARFRNGELHRLMPRNDDKVVLEKKEEISEEK